MSAGGQGMAGARRNSGRDMTRAVKRWPGIADPVAIATRAATRAATRPMDHQGRLESGMAARNHDGKSCGPAAPLAIHSGRMSKKLRFPLELRTR
jgi:hypothetical protein